MIGVDENLECHCSSKFPRIDLQVCQSPTISLTDSGTMSDNLLIIGSLIVDHEEKGRQNRRRRIEKC